MQDTDSENTAEYEGRHRPTGIDALARMGTFLELEARARRQRYHYFPRHSGGAS